MADIASFWPPSDPTSDPNISNYDVQWYSGSPGNSTPIGGAISTPRQNPDPQQYQGPNLSAALPGNLAPGNYYFTVDAVDSKAQSFSPVTTSNVVNVPPPPPPVPAAPASATATLIGPAVVVPNVKA